VPKCLLSTIILKRLECYSIYEYNVHSSVPSNLFDRPRHLIYHLVSCPVLCAAFSVPVLSLLQHVLCIIQRKKQEYSNTLLFGIIVVTALLPVDVLLKWNRPLSRFTVIRDFRIICCRISQFFYCIILSVFSTIKMLSTTFVDTFVIPMIPNVVLC
jgi:hypothetical protein